jgi:hypothetical protein
MEEKEEGDKMVTLLKDAEEIICRLSSVDDDAHYIQYLYPVIAAKIGKSNTSHDLLSTFTLIIRDYIVATGYTGELATIMEAEVHVNFADWIDALELGDEEVIKEIKALHAQAWEV